MKNPFNVFSENPFKNPLTSRVIQSMLRLATGVAAGWFLKQGWISSEDVTANMPEIVAGLMTFGAAAWAIYDKHQSEQQTNTALASTTPMSRAALDAKIAVGRSAPASVDMHEVPVIEQK
jgi:hypothetical protein